MVCIHTRHTHTLHTHTTHPQPTDKTPYREYFGVLPEGKFYYAGAVQEKVKDLDQLIDVFKRRVTKYQVCVWVGGCVCMVVGEMLCYLYACACA